MNLRLLAPGIQEQLLFHERIHGTKDTRQLRDLQKVALEVDRGRQKDICGWIIDNHSLVGYNANWPTRRY